MSFDPQEFQNYFALWQLENHSPDWVLYRSPDATTLVRNKAASFSGLISISHFIRAFDELRASGEIKQLRQPKAEEAAEPELTPEDYRKMSAREVTRRYMSDRDFKIQVDSLIERGLI
jgi:hypothetical protein